MYEPPTYLYRNSLKIEAGGASMNNTEMSNLTRIINEFINLTLCMD